MVSFLWTPALTVGFERMDAQHSRLIELMAQLHVEAEQQAPKSDFLDTLGQLATLTVAHFAEEEGVMISVTFPNLDHHRMLHERLLERFSEYRDDLERPGGKFTPGFSTFLAGWLTGHIKGPDTQYGVHSGQLTRRGDSGRPPAQ